MGQDLKQTMIVAGGESMANQGQVLDSPPVPPVGGGEPSAASTPTQLSAVPPHILSAANQFIQINLDGAEWDTTVF